MSTTVDLNGLRFTARTDPLGPAIRLAWTLPEPAGDPARPRMRVLRRERRFPGTARRGWTSVPATGADLADGTVVHDSADFPVDFEEARSEWEAGNLVTTTRRYRYCGTPPDRVLVGLVRRVVSAAGTPLSTTVEVIDRAGVEAGTGYYYTGFVGADGRYSRATQSRALATGRYGTALFPALPQADRVRDTGTPEPFTVANEDLGKGQLRRFVETVEAHADMLRGLVENLGGLHDVRHVDARLLSHLAQQIGWSIKNYLDEDAQRAELQCVPEFYRTVGTGANIAAMVNRLTGWDAKVKDFVRNLVVSFDTTRREPLAGGVVAYADGSMTGQDAPPYLRYRTVPPGSVDTMDAEAMYRLRNRLFEDDAVYSYDCGTLAAGSYVRDDKNWYSRDTVGVYIVPDVDTEVFVPQAEWDRIRLILQEFLPVNVRAVFILMPGVPVEEYDTTAEVTEAAATDTGLLDETELYGQGSDTGADTVPGWLHFITNNLAHRSVNTAVSPVGTGSRTWHTGLS